MNIGFTCSTFDLFHAGHMMMLKEAKSQCDYLIVGLQTDPTIDRPLTKNKPVQTVYERYVQVAACKYVDEVLVYSTEEELLNMLQTIHIDIRFLGDEYKTKDFEDENIMTKLWTYEDVKELVYKWVRQRMIDKKTNLYVLLSNVETLIYCYEGNVVEEPSIRVYGEIVRPNADIPDEEIKQTLIQLFTYLKEELKQYSVRFNFQGYNENVSIRIC